jgi:acetyltransferase-like isoleucine patch superfamily enzyme
MKTTSVIRIFVLFPGLLIKLWNLAKEGARDIHNQHRFKDAKIDAGCCINENSSIAPHTHLLYKCIINNSQIAAYTYIGKNCIVQNTSIGKFCSIANDVLIGLGKHPIGYFSTSPLFYQTMNPLKIKLVSSNSDFQEYEPIQIGNDVWIGARAIILDGVSIGHGAVIAANSVVTKDIPPYAIVGGVPAKILKYRFSEEKIERILQTNWWEMDISVIKKNIIAFKNIL